MESSMSERVHIQIVIPYHKAEIDAFDLFHTFCYLLAEFIVKTTCRPSERNLCCATRPYDRLIQQLKLSSCAKIVGYPYT